MTTEIIFIRRALNGYNGEVSFKDIPVYHKWFPGITSKPKSTLGKKLDKNDWIRKNINTPFGTHDVHEMLKDWELYENGWCVEREQNRKLWCYVCQLGDDNPIPYAMNYIE